MWVCGPTPQNVVYSPTLSVMMVGSMVVVSVWLIMYLVVHVCGSVQYSIIGRGGGGGGGGEHMWDGELLPTTTELTLCGA